MCSGYDRAMSRPAPSELLRRSPLAHRIRAERLIAVLRRIEPQERLLAFVDDLVGDGVGIVEITFDAPAAAADLRAVRARLDASGHGDVAVGAGTVTSASALDAAIEAGATFAVSPVLDQGLLERSVRAGLPFIPGAYSPTEIARAWAAGATFVKLFPASSLGPSHVRELHGPFPTIEAIATGGIDAANARAFLDAGCVAVGIGGSLTRASGEDRRSLIASVRAGR
jgi:2-dehydro-3-deoxyphosphogluconate aldolase / (4S)-4-hydroxy-2-oxoglutarate aldolase